jgi:RNA polymerase sigma-70 factor (ECF subfamily)
MVFEPSEVRAVTGDAGARVRGTLDARADAFRDLAERHLDAAYRLARAFMRDPAEAQDATHDAFVQAWRKWDTLRDHARFEPWFDRILANTCRNRLKRRSRFRSVEVTPASAVTPDDPMAGTDDRDALAAALARLSPDHQAVLALRYYRDLTVDQIAERLGIRPGTVKSRLHYALGRLEADVASRRETDR